MGLTKGFSSTVASCEKLLQAADEAAFLLLEDALKDDPRKGVQQALAQARRRIAAEKVENSRVQTLYENEKRVLAEHRGSVALGLDEVGRGALAGPLAVGGVILKLDEPIPGINDSKLLTASKRESLARTIKAEAVDWAVCYTSAATIDRLGLAQALRQTFSRVISVFEHRNIVFDLVIVDGNPLLIDPREVNVVGGDRTIASCACASIVAKVARDALMAKLATIYPGYDWENSKGYGSLAHRQAIETQGLSPIHRRSFCSAFEQERLF